MHPAHPPVGEEPKQYSELLIEGRALFDSGRTLVRMTPANRETFAQAYAEICRPFGPRK
jgi:hypothetical protein